jgi:hypothetical protein
MKRVQLAMVPILILCSAAHAQSGSSPTDSATDQSNRGRYTAQRLSTPRDLDRTVRNANDCAPDRASAVWSSTSALVGYACLNAGAGG